MNRIIIILASLILCCGCRPRAQETLQPRQLPVKVPEGVELPEYAQDEDIVVHSGYTASYNHTTLVPDWVAWELTAEEAQGTIEQQRQFSRDPEVRFPKASREDYSNSGWDKGHMAPHADMKWSHKALIESNYFTNICPQDRQMNAGTWRKIEELTRRLARHYGSVYVVCGPIFDEHRHGTIGGAGVAVPDKFFKALAISTSEGFRTVAFVMDNTPQNRSPRTYAVSVDSVEELIGRNLFPMVDEAAEMDFDWKEWNY